MNHRFTLPLSTLATATLIGLSLGNLHAQESDDEIAKRLKGQSQRTAPLTRGLTRGGIAPAPAAPATATRSVILRGIPTGVTAVDVADKLTTTHVTAPASTGAGDHVVTPGQAAVKIEYSVAPSTLHTAGNILFRKGSTDYLDQASREAVAQLARVMLRDDFKGTHFVIEGHASAEGDAIANQILSQQRAEQIISTLASMGVDTSCLMPIGHGESQAEHSAHSPEHLLKLDRKVMIFQTVKK